MFLIIEDIEEETREVPVALTIAGYDGSGGAGVLADCRTFHRQGIYGVAALTAVVAQSPGNVSAKEPVSDDMFRSQLNELGKYPILAAKTGMLATGTIIEATTSFFDANEAIPLVVDPVLVASAGVSLTSSSLLEMMSQRLFAIAELVTPNRFEAESMIGRKIQTVDDLEESATELFNRFSSNFLVKGGHLESGDEVVDALCIDGETELLHSPKLNVPDLHGTGCVLSALITANLAKQSSLRDAVIHGRETLREWMNSPHTWNRSNPIHSIRAVDT